MEVTVRSKQLHKHAIPIAIIILTFLVISALTFNFQNTSHLKTEVATAHALITGTFSIKPAHNGLAQITIHDQSQITPPNHPSNLNEAGRVAVISFALQ